MVVNLFQLLTFLFQVGLDLGLEVDDLFFALCSFMFDQGVAILLLDALVQDHCWFGGFSMF
jgi:hypothetical protein